MTKVHWRGEDFTVKLELRGSRKVLQLYDEDGLPYTTANAHVKGLDEEELAIKDYSENEGIYQMLVKQGVITPAHRIIFSDGWASFPVVYLKMQ